MTVLQRTCGSVAAVAIARAERGRCSAVPAAPVAARTARVATIDAISRRVGSAERPRPPVATEAVASARRSGSGGRRACGRLSDLNEQQLKTLLGEIDQLAGGSGDRAGAGERFGRRRRLSDSCQTAHDARDCSAAACCLASGNAPARGAAHSGRTRRGRRPAEEPGAPELGARGAGPGARRGGQQQALAREVRQRFAVVIRRQSNLTDDQARQLQTVEQRFQQQRNGLQRDERATRLGLAGRDAGYRRPRPTRRRSRGTSTSWCRRSTAARTCSTASRRSWRRFLTPLQRAKYQALHEQLNKRIRQMRQQSPVAARPATPPPCPRRRRVEP